MRSLALKILLLALLWLPMGLARAQTPAHWSAATDVLVPGDFNADGRDDLLVISRDPAGKNEIALSASNGRDIVRQTWSGGYLGLVWDGKTYVPYVGDFNGDGRDDVFMQKASGGADYVLLTTADGQLNAISQTIGNSALGIHWSGTDRRIVIGDFNNDGRDDLYLQAKRLTDNNVIAFASSTGHFESLSNSWSNWYLLISS